MDIAAGHPLQQHTICQHYIAHSPLTVKGDSATGSQDLEHLQPNSRGQGGKQCKQLCWLGILSHQRSVACTNMMCNASWASTTERGRLKTHNTRLKPPRSLTEPKAELGAGMRAADSTVTQTFPATWPLAAGAVKHRFSMAAGHGRHRVAGVRSV
jgi:hypothetical protein